MSGKVIKSVRVSVSGILNVEDNDIYIEVADIGTISLKELLVDFNGCNIEFSCVCDK